MNRTGSHAAPGFPSWDTLLDPTLPAEEFLSRFVAALAGVCGAGHAAVWVLDPASGEGWRCLRQSPAGGAGPAAEQIDALAESAVHAGVAEVPQPDGGRLLATSIQGTGRPSLLVAKVPADAGGEAAAVLKLASAYPRFFQVEKNLKRAERDISSFASSLDITLALSGETRFQAAALFLVNELAARFSCTGASLGWLDGHRVTVKAISNTEKFERKMEAVERLAAAMEEAVDQEEELAYPPPPDGKAITRDHATYATAQQVGALLSAPLTLPPRAGAASSRGKAEDAPAGDADGPVGALTLERASGPEFTTGEARTLRVIADHAARRLDDLHRTDRWWGARAAGAARTKAASLLGPAHTGWKLVALALAIALGVLVFGRKTFRAEGTFALKPESVSYVPAPFEGFLDEVYVEPGDRVDRGQLLFTLDRRELLLQERAAAAERERFAGEAVEAESNGRTAEMRVARARLAQSEARLELARYRLGQAEVTSPFEGVVTEGDLRERTRSPVEQGEVLLKVAQLSPLFPEAKVSESDVLHVLEGATGAVAFASRPEEPFPVVVEKIVPVARADGGGNNFTVRCRFAGDGPPPDWIRPGMGGVAKIDAGRRSLLWIYTHKTIDWLRLKLF